MEDQQVSGGDLAALLRGKFPFARVSPRWGAQAKCGNISLGTLGEADRGERERNGGSLATPPDRLYANAAISVAADWRLTVAGAAIGAS